MSTPLLKAKHNSKLLRAHHPAYKENVHPNVQARLSHSSSLATLENHGAGNVNQLNIQKLKLRMATQAFHSVAESPSKFQRMSLPRHKPPSSRASGMPYESCSSSRVSPAKSRAQYSSQKHTPSASCFSSVASSPSTRGGTAKPPSSKLGSSSVLKSSVKRTKQRQAAKPFNAYLSERAYRTAEPSYRTQPVSGIGGLLSEALKANSTHIKGEVVNSTDDPGASPPLIA